MDCIMCEEHQAVDEFGYCGQCHWRAKSMVEYGLACLYVYLKQWAAFREWEAQHREPVL